MPYDVITSGGVAKMTGSEAKTYMVIAGHTDRDFIAYPGEELIQREAGLKRRTVQVAIRGLEHKGLIRVQQGGGRSRTNLYCLTTNGAQACAFNGGESAQPGGGNSAREHLLKAHSDDGQGASPCAPTEAVNMMEQTSTKAVVGDDSVRHRNAGILRRVGVMGTDAVIGRLAGTPGLTPFLLIGLIVDAPRDVANLAGYIRARLDGGSDLGRCRPTPKQLIDVVKRRFITKLNGLPLDVPGRSVRYNSGGVYVFDGEQLVHGIATDKLPDVAIE
jgi:hypothetical protein